MDQLVYKSARDYCIETEMFDRRFLTGIIGRDGIMPGNAEERVISTKNAIRCRELRIRELGCTSIDFQSALINYQRSREFNDDMIKIGLAYE